MLQKRRLFPSLKRQALIDAKESEDAIKKAAINDWRRKSLIEPRSQEIEEEGEPDYWID
jgi:hypothetical protein